jgi:hypothetical protein
MHPLLRGETEAPRITIIDGSTGLRQLIAAFVRAHFPRAAIEDIDPFSQTMRGAGFAFGTRGNAIILGGVGTETEALDSLARLKSRPNCPPIVMLVADALTPMRAAFIAAGAFDVLRKDALSRERLSQTLKRAIATETSATGMPVTHITPPQPTYGKFHFAHDGERSAIDIDGYRFLSSMASGPMAQVFFAERIDNGRRAVVKVLTAFALHDAQESAALVELATRLRPARGGVVVDELDAGIAATFPYAVMEFLATGDLRRRMKSLIETHEALRIIDTMLAALTAIHGCGVAHADLKPECVFFRPDQSVVLIDFNISTTFGNAVRCSAVGDVLGTPTYMSPEQGAGGKIDARSDLYSVGVMFFELLMGEPPFTGDTPAQVIFRHLHDEVPLLPARIRHLQPIVDKLLAKTPEERYDSAEAVRADLKRHLS